MKLNITIVVLLIIGSSVFGQTDKRDYRIEVLKKDIIGKEFTIGKWDEKKTQVKLNYNM